MKLIYKMHDAELRRIALEHGAKAYFGSELLNERYVAVVTETPEQLRDILNDYCRAKIDAANIKAGEPMWKSAARTAQERRP